MKKADCGEFDTPQLNKQPYIEAQQVYDGLYARDIYYTFNV